MDHKEFLASLSAHDRVWLTERRNLPGLVHLALYLAVLALSSVWILASLPFWPAAVLVQGILLIFLFTLEHECIHGTPFRTPWMNVVIGHICGFILFLPANWFRFFHFAHHKYTQIPGNDPELSTAKPQTRWQYLRHISGLPTWVGQATVLATNALGRNRDHYVPKQRRAHVAWEARAYLAGYAALFGLSLLAGTKALILLWILPLLLGQPFLRLYLLAEHARCPEVANMFDNTRTTFTNRFVYFLSWNMPYHAEHHCLPSVPFHKLPALHDRTQVYLKQKSDGYAEYTRDYVRTLGKPKAPLDGQ